MSLRNNIRFFITSLKSLVLASGLVVGARIGGAVMGLSAQILLARMFGAQALGIFFLAISLATVLSVLCTLGYPLIAAPIVAKSEAERNPARLAVFLAWARREIRLVAAVLVGLVLLGIFVHPTLSADMRISLALGTLTAPVFAWLRLNGAVSNAHKKFFLAFAPELFWRPFLLLGVIAALWALSLPFDVYFVIAGHLAIMTALAAIQGKRLNTVQTHPSHEEFIREKAELGALGQRRKWRNHALPMIVATLFTLVFSDLDLVIVGLLLSESQTAVFGASIKIAMFLAFSIQAVHQVILRDTADALQNRDDAGLKTVLLRANIINTAVAIGATLAMVVAGREVLGLFGPVFQQGYVCLIVLMLAQVFRATAGPAIQILTFTGHSQASVPVFAISMVVLVAANLVLVPSFGVVGAGVAVLLVTVVWAVWLALVVKARTGLDVAIIPMPKLAIFDKPEPGIAGPIRD